jgi:uncharacterized protein YndB with AHSA1/START domain
LTTSRSGFAVAEPEYGIRIRRVFDAPPELVWAEWTTPEAFADWFGGPDSEVPLESVSMDVTPGGAWRLTMFAEPGRRKINWKGEYKEVDEPERLVFTVSDQPHDERYELVIVELADLGDGRTEMHFEQRGFLSPEQYEYTKQGWGTFFDRLAERLVASAEPDEAS